MTKMNHEKRNAEDRARVALNNTRVLAKEKKSPPLHPAEGSVAFGTCPECKGCSWWDYRPQKASGRYKPNAPDAKCSECDYALWPDDRKAKDPAKTNAILERWGKL